MSNRRISTDRTTITLHRGEGIIIPIASRQRRSKEPIDISTDELVFEVEGAGTIIAEANPADPLGATITINPDDVEAVGKLGAAFKLTNNSLTPPRVLWSGRLFVKGF
jgi:hypothetical protein